MWLINAGSLFMNVKLLQNFSIEISVCCIVEKVMMDNYGGITLMIKFVSQTHTILHQ